MRRIAFVLILSLLGLSSAGTAEPDLYERLAKRLTENAALAGAIGKAAPQMREVAWMIGSWDVTWERPDEVAKGTSIVSPIYGGVWLEIRDSYPSGNQDIGYLAFDPALDKWVSVSIDALVNANRGYATGWKDGRIAFEGDYTILGVPAHLRQTIAKVSDTEYRLSNEELIGGKWVFLDRYIYRKLVAK